MALDTSVQAAGWVCGELRKKLTSAEIKSETFFLRKMQPQLMFYYRWTLKQIGELSEVELCEAWQNLAWCRKMESKN